MAQPLGLLLLTLFLLAAPALAEDGWIPLSVDGARLPGPGVRVREGKALFPVVSLGRRLRCPVGLNRASSLITVAGREIATDLVAADGEVFVPEATVRKAFPDLLLEVDTVSARAWTSADRRRAAAASGGALALLDATPSLEDGRLAFALEVGNRGSLPVTGAQAVVTVLGAEGRTYAVFRQPLPDLAPGGRRTVQVLAWLTPARLVGEDGLEVDLLGLEGQPGERRALRWRASLEP